MEACTDIQLLNILRIVKLGINTITIIVPAILVIFIIIDVIKSITSNNVDTKKLFGTIVKKGIAAIAIFVLPMIINLVLSLVDDDLYYAHCYTNANSNYIKQQAIKVADQEIAKANTACSSRPDLSAYEKARKAVKAIPEKSTRESYTNSLNDLRLKCNSK